MNPTLRNTQVIPCIQVSLEWAQSYIMDTWELLCAFWIKVSYKKNKSEVKCSQIYPHPGSLFLPALGWYKSCFFPAGHYPEIVEGILSITFTYLSGKPKLWVSLPVD